MARNSDPTAVLDTEMLAEFSVVADVPPAEPTEIGEGSLVSKVLPVAVWKQFSIICGIGVLICILFWGLSESSALASGSGLTVVECGRPVAGLLLLFGGQFGAVIAFQRSQSEFDFRGRYRWWSWLGFGLMSLGALLVTKLYLFVPPLLVAGVESLIGPVHSAQKALVIVPATMAFILMVSQIVPDMARCRRSQALFVMGLLVYVVRQMLLMTNPEDTNAQTASLLLVGAAFLCFAAMFLHAGFVVYICNDPPSEKHSVTAGEVATASPIAMPEGGDSGEAEYDEPQPSIKPTNKTRRKASRKRRAA